MFRAFRSFLGFHLVSTDTVRQLTISGDLENQSCHKHDRRLEEDGRKLRLLEGLVRRDGFSGYRLQVLRNPECAAHVCVSTHLPAFYITFNFIPEI
ncbi:hypothetical protein EYF80_038657 [Liparis tanakae]|uniref:Uncharacterized protein n=1 Tax=Liparis tanakae TaxID=230148 RepID=A0A4Z2GC29_9TELE|nr:hypothetical protein EYF80_038657 [Liparis tanakae]